MACLCPARRKNEWKKRVQANSRPRNKPAAPGRITGSTSMDILVRVAREKNNEGRKMILMVLHDYIPCTYDELGAKRGDRVIVLYGEHDWAYAIRDDGVEGFLPWSCLTSPAKFSRLMMPTDESPVDTTNEVSSLTLAVTKALDLSTTVYSSNESNDFSTSDSDSFSMNDVRCSPSSTDSIAIARLRGHVDGTPSNACRRQDERRDDIRDDSSSSGVSSDSDNSASPANSPKCRLAFKVSLTSGDKVNIVPPKKKVLQSQAISMDTE